MENCEFSMRKMLFFFVYLFVFPLILTCCAGTSKSKGIAFKNEQARNIKTSQSSKTITAEKKFDQRIEDGLIKEYNNNPRDAEIILKLCKYYFNLKKYDLMILYLGKLKNSDQNLYRYAESDFIEKSFTVLHSNLINYVKDKNYDRAITEYLKLINLFPERTELYYEITAAYIKSDKSHTALIYITEIQRRNPEDPYLNAALADLNYYTKNYEAAKGYYERAYGLEQIYYEPYIRFALIHAEAGNFVKAENLFLKTFEAHKEKIDVLYEIAKFYARFYKYDRSIIYYKKMIEFYDADILILIEAAETAILANDNEYAVKLSERILGMDKENISAWMLISRAYTNKGDFIAAYRCSQEIQKLRKY